ncbi:MAG: PadR family transcriptional regulator [Gemmatimonadales bacterium]
MTPKDSRAAKSVLPLKPADFHILMVLIEGALHGYGIMQRVAEQSNGRVQLEVGSLYRLIARMTEEGLIVESKTSRGGSDRRRNYRITRFGDQVAKLEAQRLEDVVRAARAHDLLTDKTA